METLRLPITIEISKDGLNILLQALGQPARDTDPPIQAQSPENDVVELPLQWQQIDEQHNVRYTWGEHQDLFDPFVVYEGRTSRGAERLAIGKCERASVHGRDRIYYIVVAIGPAGGHRAIAEFLATDDYDETGQVIAIIRGKEGSARLFDTSDELPVVYGSWPVVTYRDRVDYPGSYTKQALLCSETDHDMMLNHSLAQIQLRNLKG